jgi:hypothetical protein
MSRTVPMRGRAERRATPGGPVIASAAEIEHKQSVGLFVPVEGLGLLALRGLQGRPMYSSDEGQT